ncbi:hypothetical protein SCP_0506840 [Sparassis crispa]|uniref:Uncharacterized protein n=1 Tax=Sparassis crispa TaxID=139825 RepID=A0A401GN87_9APHY|nr:hypothetical protein SCP_0506840 [Sparassis crispa]GBE83629.1 hypothetical protein SCP_0506840 [Sparassis crispa]
MLSGPSTSRAPSLAPSLDPSDYPPWSYTNSEDDEGWINSTIPPGRYINISAIRLVSRPITLRSEIDIHLGPRRPAPGTVTLSGVEPTMYQHDPDTYLEDENEENHSDAATVTPGGYREDDWQHQSTISHSVSTVNPAALRGDRTQIPGGNSTRQRGGRPRSLWRSHRGRRRQAKTLAHGPQYGHNLVPATEGHSREGAKSQWLSRQRRKVARRRKAATPRFIKLGLHTIDMGTRSRFVELGEHTIDMSPRPKWAAYVSILT